MNMRVGAEAEEKLAGVVRPLTPAPIVERMTGLKAIEDTYTAKP